MERFLTYKLNNFITCLIIHSPIYLFYVFYRIKLKIIHLIKIIYVKNNKECNNESEFCYFQLLYHHKS